MAHSCLGSHCGSILLQSLDHLLSPFPPAAVGQVPAHRGNPSPRLPARPCLVLGTASAVWPGGVMEGLLAMPQLSIPASCPLPGHNVSWSVVSSADVSFILNVFRGLCPCCLATPELGGDGVRHSLYEALINIQEGAKGICLRPSPKLSCSLAQLYSEGRKLGRKTSQEQA